ncbi:hypothetical protein RHSIM_Rhsim01G0097200 [Rhododendron simsii]|uniref:Late embryogenesis abundant protein LEA-2 subgroup domain-containing protein n=1 Tax=Rhododendron simsii TaxID=118357 RepID=A0A834HG46_RHOSS|nr:hypothetical protein RHSIM_Rhsim01G0097200 [Rhododendron simsii]
MALCIHKKMIQASSNPYSTSKEPYVTSPSPSRDSNGSDHSMPSSVVTPAYTSPTDSPLHSSVSASMGSNSGTFRPWKQQQQRYHVADKPYWPEFTPIREEGEERDYEGDVSGNEVFGRCLVWILALALSITVFCLIVWGASRPYTPRVSVKSLTVHKFDFGQGSDHTGVPTKFLTVNTSVEMVIYNPATFFGIHFSSSSVQLFYSEIAVASGQLKKHYQPRKSEEIVKVKVEGNKVPLYGAGASLAAFDYRFYRVPLRLELDIRLRADVMGKLVRTKYRIRVSCSLVVDSRIDEAIRFKDNSCSYD